MVRALNEADAMLTLSIKRSIISGAIYHFTEGRIGLAERRHYTLKVHQPSTKHTNNNNK